MITVSYNVRSTAFKLLTSITQSFSYLPIIVLELVKTSVKLNSASLQKFRVSCVVTLYNEKVVELVVKVDTVALYVKNLYPEA